jgi:Putative secretion activating protein
MPDAFTLAHTFTARWEGGYANHPNDPGGATNYGISLRWLRAEGLDINGDGLVDEGDILAVTPEIAAELFRKCFWDRAKLGWLPLPVGIVMYDACVNMGINRAVGQLQDCCAMFPPQGDHQPSLRSGIGPITVSVVGTLCPDTESCLALCEKLLDARARYYTALAKNIRFNVFLKGWLNRVEALRAYVRDVSLMEAIP